MTAPRNDGAPRVVALRAEDAASYREMMLYAYVEAADAFTATPDERAAQPMQWWADRIAPVSGLGEAFGAWSGERLVGSAALEYSARAKIRHSALVIGVYVRPEARAAGFGAALMQAVISAARVRAGLRMLRLTVTEGNAAALRLYESVGFRSWGIEPAAIRTPSGDLAKVHMALPLDRRADG